MNKHFSIAILLGAIAILQFHGIRFWVGYVGPIGVLWSVLLEASSFYLWYQRSVPKRLLGLLISLLLLAGPLWQVGTPLLREVYSRSNNDSTRAVGISVQRNRISTLERSMAAYQRNSTKRLGWLPLIQQTQEQINQAQRRLRKEVQTPPQSQMNWQRFVVIAMQIVALIVLQVVAVLAVIDIAAQRKEQTSDKPSTVATDSPSYAPAGPADTNHSETYAASEPPPDTRLIAGYDVSELSERLENYRTQKKLSAKEFANRHGLNPRDLSFIRNHSHRVAEGKQVASPRVINKLAQILDTLS